jgi:hypothetical protein
MLEGKRAGIYTKHFNVHIRHLILDSGTIGKMLAFEET